MRPLIYALSGLLIWIAADLPAYAKYQVLSKAPAGYLDRTQQGKFHKRLMREYGSYSKDKSAKVRGWHGELSRGSGSEAGLPRLAHIYRLANKYVVYKTERVDVWSTPGETISRGYGDCDDYAHIYLASAGLMGYELRHLWLVAGYFHGPKGKVGHAIAVIDQENGEQWVLDNLYKRVVPENKHKLFKPVYSINIERQAAFIQLNTQFSEIVW